MISCYVAEYLTISVNVAATCVMCKVYFVVRFVNCISLAAKIVNFSHIPVFLKCDKKLRLKNRLLDLLFNVHQSFTKFLQCKSIPANCSDFKN